MIAVRKIRFVPLGLLATLGLLTGCMSLAPDVAEPQLVAEIPDQYRLTEDAGEYRPVAWWGAFEDPVLDGLVDEALLSNLDIVEAAARVEQASAQARLSRSALLPSVNAGVDGSFSSSPVEGLAFGDIAGGVIDRIENESYSASLGASYELDLFGRARSDFLAAEQDAIASSHDLRTVQLASAAETISVYFEIVDTVRQIELVELTNEVLEDRAARSSERFERGLIESFELYQVRQDLRSTQASLPQLQTARGAAVGRLALLLGTYIPQTEEMLAGPLQPRLVFEPVPSGLPIDLISHCLLYTSDAADE